MGQFNTLERAYIIYVRSLFWWIAVLLAFLVDRWRSDRILLKNSIRPFYPEHPVTSRLYLPQVVHWLFHDHFMSLPTLCSHLNGVLPLLLCPWCFVFLISLPIFLMPSFPCDLPVSFDLSPKLLLKLLCVVSSFPRTCIFSHRYLLCSCAALVNFVPKYSSLCILLKHVSSP